MNRKALSRSMAIADDLRDLSDKDMMMLSAYSLNHPVTDPSEMAGPVPPCENIPGMPKYTGPGAKTADGGLLKLADRLLSFGGSSVCLFEEEEDLENIMTFGQLWYGKTVRMKKGRPNGCHSNSAELYSANRNALDSSRLMICTGYALSGDGMWRQHSWLAWIKARSVTLVETTTPRIAYFGFCMTDDRCREFAYNNI